MIFIKNIVYKNINFILGLIILIGLLLLSKYNIYDKVDSNDKMCIKESIIDDKERTISICDNKELFIDDKRIIISGVLHIYNLYDKKSNSNLIYVIKKNGLLYEIDSNYKVNKIKGLKEIVSIKIFDKNIYAVNRKMESILIKEL
ncbi:MAG: hypothetical protein RSB77_02735 [Bacilli bacterium]